MDNPFLTPMSKRHSPAGQVVPMSEPRSEYQPLRILLDVDGVLNAVTRNPDLQTWTDWRKDKAHGFTIRWSATVARRVREWAETPGVEVLWLTTWEDLANLHISPMLDLPSLVVAGKQPFRDKGGWWKFDHAKALWDEDHTPFVWIDDDLDGRTDDGAAEWVRSLNGQALGIRPDSTKGLTQRLLDEVDAFLLAARQGADIGSDGSSDG